MIDWWLDPEAPWPPDIPEPDPDDDEEEEDDDDVVILISGGAW